MKDAVGLVAAAAGLLCTFDLPSADAALYRFDGSITPDQTLTQVYFALGVGNCVYYAYCKKIADSVPADVTTPFSITLDVAYPNIDGYSILGFYDEANDGIAITYRSTDATTILARSTAQEWVGASMPVVASDATSFFQGISESGTAGYLRRGAPDGYDVGYLTCTNYRRSPYAGYDHDLTFLNFSGATYGGTATIYMTTVPEPATLSLLAIPSMLILARRRND